MTGRNWWPCRAAEAATLLLGLLGLPAVASTTAPEATSAPASAPADAQAAAASALAASAPTSTPAAPGSDVGATVPPAHFNHGTLWRLHAPSGAVGHLLGTIHIGQVHELGLPGPTWSLLLTANRLVVELATTASDDETIERLQRLPGNETLARQLAPAEQQRLQQRLAAAGLGLRTPLRYKPWVLTQLLQSAAPLTLETLDDRLVRQARRQRIPVLSLETLAEQFGAFECIAPAEQAALLKDTLAMPEGFFETLNREALALYRAQRTADLVRLLADRFPLAPAARAASARATQCIIGERNQRFAQRLQPLLAENGVFAAIGAAHLVGSGGVLAQLAAAGFRLERMDTVNTPTPTPENRR